MENDLNFDMETEFEPLDDSEIRMLLDLFDIWNSAILLTYNMYYYL